MTSKYVPDTMSYDGATRLKNILDAYWWKLGLKGARARIVCETIGKEERNIYVVRSNVSFDEKVQPVVKIVPHAVVREPFIWESGK